MDKLNPPPTDRNTLFRREVLENKQQQLYGEVFINMPLQYQIWLPIFLIIIVCILVFLAFGQFTEKSIVNGYISSAKGMVRVFPSKNGIIMQSHVNQGLQVKKGDELFLIDTNYDFLSKNKEHRLLMQMEQRKNSAEKEIYLKQKELQLLKGLLTKKYITQTVFNQKRDEYIKLKNHKMLLEMELIKYQQHNGYRIRAPISGKISAVMYKPGQYIHTAKALIKILPEEDELLAEIFIPVRNAGFIKSGDEVLIRYDAYPHENFGSYKAKIQEVSQSILTDAEEDKPITIGTPYYKVTAALDSPFVTVFGQHKKIQDGMTFTAVIKGRKRTIWQWILDPIYRFRGDLF